MKAQEQRWLKGIRQGDKRASRALVGHYLPSLYAYFKGLGCNTAEAEDLAQETFLELWKSLKTYRGESSLKTWIFMLGRRAAWKQFHRRKPREILMREEEESAWEPQEEAAQEEWVFSQQRDALLHAGIEELPTLHREVLVLHYMEGLSYHEMAQVLDIAEGTAKSRLNRALKQLRVKLSRTLPSD